MPRFPRLFVPHIPLHIVQRGHDRNDVFLRRSDFRYYLKNILETKARFGIQVIAYCLMTNHVHLVLIPGHASNDVSKMMRILAARQTRRVNKRDHRSGTLWEGRFHASLIDSSEYLLACCRYIDLNPVRAALVGAPGDYEWSGFRGRAALCDDPVLDGHAVFESLTATPSARPGAYQEFVRDGVADSELALIRKAIQRNQLTGNDRFRIKMEARIGTRISNKPRGRPRKLHCD